LFSPVGLDAAISISPNPARDVFQVKVSAEKPSDFILLLNDGQGRLVRQQTVSGQPEFTADCQVADLPTGLYVLTVANSKGQMSLAVVKQ